MDFFVCWPLVPWTQKITKPPYGRNRRHLHANFSRYYNVQLHRKETFCIATNSISVFKLHSIQVFLFLKVFKFMAWTTVTGQISFTSCNVQFATWLSLRYSVIFVKFYVEMIYKTSRKCDFLENTISNLTWLTGVSEFIPYFPYFYPHFPYFYPHFPYFYPALSMFLSSLSIFLSALSIFLPALSIFLTRTFLISTRTMHISTPHFPCFHTALSILLTALSIFLHRTFHISTRTIHISTRTFHISTPYYTYFYTALSIFLHRTFHTSTRTFHIYWSLWVTLVTDIHKTFLIDEGFPKTRRSEKRFTYGEMVNYFSSVF